MSLNEYARMSWLRKLERGIGQWRERETGGVEKFNWPWDDKSGRNGNFLVGCFFYFLR